MFVAVHAFVRGGDVVHAERALYDRLDEALREGAEEVRSTALHAADALVQGAGAEGDADQAQAPQREVIEVEGADVGAQAPDAHQAALERHCPEVLAEPGAAVKKQLATLISNLALANVDISEAAGVRANVEELRRRDRDLDNTMQELDRTLELLQNQQIDHAQLRKVFDEIDEMYAESTIDVKRRLLNAVIEEVRCTVKRGEKG